MTISQEKAKAEALLHIYYKRYEKHKKIAQDNFYKVRKLENVIKRKFERREKLYKCVEQYKNFFGADIKNSWNGKQTTDNINIFIKFALESGVRGKDVAEYLGCKRPKSIFNRRTALTKKFWTDVDLKVQYNRFISSIVNEEKEKSSS